LVRDMNYEFAKFKGDTKRLSEIYFGTPYASFKERMNAEGFKTDKTHWNCPLEFGLDHHEAISIDFTEGRIGKRSFKMDDGLTSQLLIGLTEDLFRPTYYTSLYEELYPNEEFESDLSRDKLNKVLKRARQFIKKNEMPLNLNFKDGFIWLSGSSPVSVVKRSYSERRSQLSTILRKVERECGLEFKSSDAKKLLEVSTGKLHSILTSAEEKNLISKSGKGKNTIYKMNIPKR
ncbi:MAG: hypothetical protein KDD25_06515, partial [Bdellovibrionales bacterium]|nr:hypothetical protein [Bdellovibrionales bacterium]